MIIRMEQAVEGMPMPAVPPAPADLRTVAVVRSTFDVTEAGARENCASGNPPFMSPCPGEQRFEPGTARHSVVVHTSVFTSGDPNIMPALERFSQ